MPTASLADPKVLGHEKILAPEEVYRRDVNWIEHCDLLIAEVSTPSHGVGYEICYALQIGKPVFCVHRAGKPVSKMITGNSDPNITVMAYGSIDQAIEFLRTSLNTLSEKSV